MCFPSSKNIFSASFDPVSSDFLQVRESRDAEAARSCLAAIEECARTREGNLLALAVEAARARFEFI